MPEELISEVQKKQSESVKTEETSEEKTRTEKMPEIPEGQSEQSVLQEAVYPETENSSDTSNV